MRNLSRTLKIVKKAQLNEDEKCVGQAAVGFGMSHIARG